MNQSTQGFLIHPEGSNLVFGMCVKSPEVMCDHGKQFGVCKIWGTMKIESMARMGGCPNCTIPAKTDKVEKKVNPLKASKRGNK